MSTFSGHIPFTKAVAAVFREYAVVPTNGSAFSASNHGFLVIGAAERPYATTVEVTRTALRAISFLLRQHGNYSLEQTPPNCPPTFFTRTCHPEVLSALGIRRHKSFRGASAKRGYCSTNSPSKPGPARCSWQLAKTFRLRHSTHAQESIQRAHTRIANRSAICRYSLQRNDRKRGGTWR